MMDPSAFWRLIKKLDREALKDGEDEGATEPLAEALAEYSEEDIREFENILVQCLYDIDGQIYAEKAGESGRSADGFLYVRCYVPQVIKNIGNEQTMISKFQRSSCVVGEGRLVAWVRARKSSRRSSGSCPSPP